MKAYAYRSFAALCLTIGISFGALGQTAQEFYNGRQLHLIVGYEPGNDYDVGARLLAKYLARQLPGQPTIIVQNMPQAASIVAANYIYNIAPKDGSYFASISRNIPTQAVMGQSNIEADPRRYNWLGATSFPARVCAAATNATVKSAQDIFTTELITGSVGAGSSTSIVPTVLNRVLSTKFKMIEGYRGAQDILLAIERGEVQGVCMSLGQFRSHEQKFRDGKLRYLFRAEEAPLPTQPKVPSIYDYAKTKEQRQLMRFVFSSTEFGRSYVFPPEVPKDRVAFMRKAIADAVNDPELVEEAAKMKLDMIYRAPKDLEQLVTHLYETPPALIETIKKISPNVR